MQRFWNLIWKGNRGESAGSAEAKQSPGLPWPELEALLGQGVRTLELETADVGDGSPPFMKWSEANIRKLIHAFRELTVIVANESQPSLIHLTLMGKELACATLLFDYAERERWFVDLCWNRGDILSHALERGLRELVEFVLDRITRRCARPAESASVISSHFGELRRKFPDVLERFVREGKFCFEYGRFEVPLEIFVGESIGSIGRMGDVHEKWEETDGEKVKELWTAYDVGLTACLSNQSGSRVTAVSKFVLIESPFSDGNRNVASHLVLPGYDAELFMCETVKALVGWRWHHCIKKVLRMSAMNRFISVLLFFVFAGTYGLYSEELGDKKSTLTLVGRISIVLCYINLIPSLIRYSLNPRVCW